jgi:hypothetical protein
MSTMFQISFLSLTTLIVLQALVLHDVFREISRLPLLTSQHTARPALPRFSRRLLDTPDLLTDQDLRLRTTGLLFISPAIAKSLAPHVLTSIIHAMWHKFQGVLYVVCAGTVNSCRRLRDEQSLLHAYGGDVRVVLDVDGQLAKACGLSADKPSAIVVDANGLIQRTGSLVEESSARDEQDSRTTVRT